MHMAPQFKAAVLSLALSLALGAQAQGTAPNDAQIAAIVVTANQVDIDAGKLAKGKTYIDNEVTYHQAVIDALDKTLMGKQGG
jgi:putative membrane protein